MQTKSKTLIKSVSWYLIVSGMILALCSIIRREQNSSNDVIIAICYASWIYVINKIFLN